MNKWVKYTVLCLCLIIFGVISFNVYNNNDLYIDSVIYNFISKYFINDNVTPIVKFVTNIGDTLCIIIISFISLFIFRNKRINISIVVNLITGTLLNNILKLIFMRPRPEINALVEETTYCFPSGHSMVSMIFYGYLIYLIYHLCDNKIIKWIFILILSILIIIIGFSRVYLGVHYVSDVIGAFTFGIAYLILYTEITKKMIN